MRGGMLREDDPAVVRNVEPLVGIRGPRIRPFDAVDELAIPRARGRPEPEGAVDVDPGFGGLASVRDRCKRIDRAGVDVARLGADDRGRLRCLERLLQRFGAHPALTVHWDELETGGSEPEQPERTIDRDVSLGAGEDADPRGADESVTSDIPSRAGQDVLARSRKRSRVRALGAGDEPARDTVGQAEQLDEPPRGDLLDGCGSRRGDDREAVLIPRGREPVRRHRRRQRASDHETEIASGLRSDDARLGSRDKLRDDLRIGDPVVGEGAAECFPQLLDRRTCRHRTLPERVQVSGGVVGGEPQQLVVRHPAILLSERGCSTRLPPRAARARPDRPQGRPAASAGEIAGSVGGRRSRRARRARRADARSPPRPGRPHPRASRRRRPRR